MPPDSDQESDASETKQDSTGEVESAQESDLYDDCYSPEENEEETEETKGRGWESRDGQIVWSPSHAETLPYLPATRVTPGPTQYAKDRISCVKSCFDLLITEDIIQGRHVLVDTTNLQARRSVADWSDVHATDLQAYIGLLILAGVYRSRNESTASLWDEYHRRAIFRATMPKRPDVCVDEQFLPFRGRCEFRQHVPNHPAKYGIKVWATCDVVTSYAWKLQLCTGASADSPAEERVDQRKRVVLELTEGLQGNTVTCDNVFTSYALADELLKRKVTLVDVHGVTDYNRCKRAVDNLDKAVCTYSCKRKTTLWPLVFFYYILDVSAYNAFVLWTAVEQGEEVQTEAVHGGVGENARVGAVGTETAPAPCTSRCRHGGGSTV
ncbi:piggyBac transposable element-derived protein 4-like protein [Lates japonicus]|uniref:PiggyBac transposable element-derived protein 4-like protein n=1 Tax=Lates japonicus TaxID=270547 RepID=A0AAD3RI55_LATJO|nr:piggyBac transposable element-derived protein 4-like protein [Lates japonicus]